MREQSEQANSKFLERAFHTTNLAALRHLPARALVRAATATAVPAPPHMGPVIDGYFLPDSVPSIYAAGRQAHVPLLAGWNADEIRAGIAQAKEAMTADRFRREAQADFGADVAAFLALYPAASDSQAVQSAGDFASDRFIAYSTWRWLETQVRTAGAPVYRYRLDLGAPTDALHPIAAGAFHADDIEYVFGTLDSRPGAVWRPEDRQLSDLIGTYWTNFARTSDPNQPPSAGLPPWPIYHADDGWQVMHLDAVSAARADDDRSRYLFLDLRWGPKP